MTIEIDGRKYAIDSDEGLMAAVAALDRAGLEWAPILVDDQVTSLRLYAEAVEVSTSYCPK